MTCQLAVAIGAGLRQHRSRALVDAHRYAQLGGQLVHREVVGRGKCAAAQQIRPPEDANQAELGSIRSDVEGDQTLAGLTKTLGNTLRPIPVSPELLGYLDQTKRLEFIKQWQAAIKGTK